MDPRKCSPFQICVGNRATGIRSRYRRKGVLDGPWQVEATELNLGAKFEAQKCRRSAAVAAARETRVALGCSNRRLYVPLSPNASLAPDRRSGTAGPDQAYPFRVSVTAASVVRHAAVAEDVIGPIHGLVGMLRRDFFIQIDPQARTLRQLGVAVFYLHRAAVKQV